MKRIFRTFFRKRRIHQSKISRDKLMRKEVRFAEFAKVSLIISIFSSFTYVKYFTNQLLIMQSIKRKKTYQVLKRINLILCHFIFITWQSQLYSTFGTSKYFHNFWLTLLFDWNIVDLLLEKIMSNVVLCD